MFSIAIRLAWFYNEMVQEAYIWIVSKTFVISANKLSSPLISGRMIMCYFSLVRVLTKFDWFVNKSVFFVVQLLHIIIINKFHCFFPWIVVMNLNLTWPQFSLLNLSWWCAGFDGKTYRSKERESSFSSFPSPLGSAPTGL